MTFPDTAAMTLREICENAMRAGREIDLTGCDYGPHKRSNSYLGVQTYYYFLAGFVRTLGFAKILEIGTSHGGSMMAIDRGCSASAAERRLVTVDKVDVAGPGLLGLRNVARVIGDSRDAATLLEIKQRLTTPIDLLYIDSKHSYDHTMRNIQLHGAEFRPRFVILDDIHLNAEMEKVWAEVSAQYRHQAFDASQLAERPGGFGILDDARVTARPVSA